MKKFFVNFLLFIIPIVVLSFLLDSFVSSKISSRKDIARDEYSVWNDILESKIKDDILIQGSSRAWVHFDPSMITDSTGISCYNIGMDGHHFLMQQTRQKILQKYNGKPKMIIYSVEATTLSNRNDLYNISQFLPYLIKYKEDFKPSLTQYDGFDYFDYELPLVRYYGEYYLFAKMMFPNNYIHGRIKGFEGQHTAWNNDFEKAKSVSSSISAVVDSATVVSFNEYLKKCINDNIRIVLVYSPEYIEGQKYVINREEIIQMYRDFSNQYNIPFLDFSTDTISYQKKYFYNATHLNKQGAELFTKKLIVKMKDQQLFDTIQ